MKKLNKLAGGKLTLGGAIASIRMSDEISQVEFAKKLKVSPSYLCDLEHDRKPVSPKKAAEFAKALKHSEKQFVRLCLQDLLDKNQIVFEVSLEDAA